MKIAEVKAFALSFKLENAPRRGTGQPIKKDMVVVRVRTTDGITGYGESHHALAPTVVADIVNHNLAPIVVGANALEVEDIWQKVYTKQAQTHGPGWSLYKALSGVDMALWDVRGKALGQPVYRLLGGSRKKSVLMQAAYVSASSRRPSCSRKRRASWPKAIPPSSCAWATVSSATSSACVMCVLRSATKSTSWSTSIRVIRFSIYSGPCLPSRNAGVLARRAFHS